MVTDAGDRRCVIIYHQYNWPLLGHALTLSEKRYVLLSLDRLPLHGIVFMNSLSRRNNLSVPTGCQRLQNVMNIISRTSSSLPYIGVLDNRTRPTDVWVTMI